MEDFKMEDDKVQCEESDQEELIPRNYQVQLMEIARKENTIIFLPTGAGKTFIAVMVLKQLAGDLQRPYNENGKLSIILVNTVALVNQHAEYIRRHTPFSVGRYSGDMGVDYWNKDKWLIEFNNNQVLVMTSQVLLNLINNFFIDLNQVNLLIFDECHRGVNDHSMRLIMLTFANLKEPPRVIGLTATLLNGNCKPERVMEQVTSLETTYLSKVATVDELHHVVGYSTNPDENVKITKTHVPSEIENEVINILNDLHEMLKIKIEGQRNYSYKKSDLIPLEPEKGLSDFRNLIKDAIIHIEMLGIFGGYLSLIAYTIQLERFKVHSQDKITTNILNAMITTFSYIKCLLDKKMSDSSERDKVFNYSSDKVKVLIDIFREFKLRSKQELCGIIFVQRRFTAKIIHFILEHLKKVDDEFNYIKSDFLIGFNAPPHLQNRQGLYYVKQSYKVLEKFAAKEINVIVASNVLEEGIDMPQCSLVVRFDNCNDYRSYIQSKGRARHKNSYFYMMVKESEVGTFFSNYHMYQNIEKILNDYLIGKNAVRSFPTSEMIQEMYDEAEFPPYYVNGSNSAQVNLYSAISLLSQYCTALPSDRYTDYYPEWYREVSTISNGCRVVIILPTICPISEPIKGPFVSNIKLAKRAAALKACIELHKIGELDDNLLPKKYNLPDENTNFLFEHYPVQKEREAGTKKNRRQHVKQIADSTKGQLQPNNVMFLHVIELNPKFNKYEFNLANDTLKDLYLSGLCYGLITPHPLPPLCEFPVFVSQGEINVNIKINQKELTLSNEQIIKIRGFYRLVLNDLLKILRPFLVFDNGEDAEVIIVVPICKDTKEIDFMLIDENKNIKNPKLEPTHENRINLDVSEDSYIGKIVSPWYRPDDTNYVVTKVCTDLNAYSDFPSEDFDTYINYFDMKYNLSILSPSQPLLAVKALSKRLNCIKPRGVGGKKRRNMMYEESEEHLIPELCVKQEFPASLWVQAMLLPTILHRVTQLLRADNLRKIVSSEKNIGVVDLPENCKWSPLELDEHLITYEIIPKEKVTERRELNHLNPDTEQLLALPSTQKISKINRDFSAKILEMRFPWKDSQEPKDIERDLTVNSTEINMYEQFVCTNINVNSDEITGSVIKKSSVLPAITYDKNYEEKSIHLLEKHENVNGPELADIYKSLATAKCNDIVNLERLETLGDSFLKFISSLYVILKYPNYNEGKASSLKCRLISNKNLYYLGTIKKISGYLKPADFSPSSEWLPPSFCVPDIIQNRILNNQLSINTLFNFDVSVEEQVSGVLTDETNKRIMEEECSLEKDDCIVEEEYPLQEDDNVSSLYGYLNQVEISDKTVSDVVEALLGAYFNSNGINGAIKFIEFMKIIPSSENLQKLIDETTIDPVLNTNATQTNIDFHISTWQSFEKQLGYHFNNRAYLLQALTHSSYVPNRVTSSYETLEFLGDAVLDFLITCFIYESCGYLDPGQLTDLRSALVNNNTFASYTVRCGFYKYLLFINTKLQGHIDKFVQFQEHRNHVIDDQVLILLEEGELHLAEHVDVPKVLGDLFEALAGAVYLDCGKDLKVVWKVFYKIMWKEIDLFSKDIPKNCVRLLYEKPGAHPYFYKAVALKEEVVMVKVEFLVNGVRKMVHGFGVNKNLAKRAAAKIALRVLSS